MKGKFLPEINRSKWKSEASVDLFLLDATDLECWSEEVLSPAKRIVKGIHCDLLIFHRIKMYIWTFTEDVLPRMFKAFLHRTGLPDPRSLSKVAESVLAPLETK